MFKDFPIIGNRKMINHLVVLTSIALRIHCTVLQVTSSRQPGPFYGYNKTCEFDPVTLSKEGQKDLDTALTKNGIITAWLPIQRKNLSNWFWLSGNIYTSPLSHPGTRIPGHDCAVLWAGEGNIVDEACSRKFLQYICESGVPCSTQHGELRCLDTPHKTYRVFTGESTWFQAKEACVQKNATLGSLGSGDKNEIIQQIKAKAGPDEKIWIGLRLTDFVYHMPYGGESNINYFNWGEDSPCACPDKRCVIVDRNATGSFAWKAESCSASHPFVCLQHIEPTPRAHKGIIAVGTILPVIMIFIILLSWRNRRRIINWFEKTDRNGPMIDSGPTEEDLMLEKDKILASDELSTDAINIRDNILNTSYPGRSHINILLLGLPGTGKSSLISSLLTALTPGGYKAYAKPGEFDKAGLYYTHRIRPYRLYCHLMQNEPYPFQCRPILWDCPGLMDDSSDLTYQLLRLIIKGKLPLNVDINNFLMRKETVESQTGEMETCSCMDMILFVHDLKTVPENLCEAVSNVIRDCNKEATPLILIINKIDTDVGGQLVTKITDKISRNLGLYKQVDRIFCLSCYFAKDNQQSNLERDTEIDKNMCKVWNEILNRTHYQDLLLHK